LLVGFQRNLLSKHNIALHERPNRGETQAHLAATSIVYFENVWRPHVMVDAIFSSTQATHDIKTASPIELLSLAGRKPVPHKPQAAIFLCILG
jgi:hypothetical protein